MYLHTLDDTREVSLWETGKNIERNYIPDLQKHQNYVSAKTTWSCRKEYPRNFWKYDCVVKLVMQSQSHFCIPSS